jgi:hypothetical protein
MERRTWQIGQLAEHLGESCLSHNMGIVVDLGGVGLLPFVVGVDPRLAVIAPHWQTIKVRIERGRGIDGHSVTSFRGDEGYSV